MTAHAAQSPPQEDPSGVSAPHRRILRLERNVFFAGLVSFFMDISSEMVYSLVPLFLSSVLGVTGSVIGLIEGIAETTASLVKLVSGWLSDRLGRRKALMGAGYGISVVSRVLLATAGAWSQVLGSRFVDRLGKGIRTAPRDAIVADSSTVRDLGRNFGFHRAMDQSGAVIGPGLAALILLLAPENYRLVFWLSIIPGSVAVLIIVLFIQERRVLGVDGRRPPTAAAGAAADGGVAMASVSVLGAAADGTGRDAPARTGGITLRARLARLRGPLLTYILITGLFSLGNSSDAFLILRANQDLGVSLALIPILYVAFNAVYSALSIPAGLLADVVGRRQLAVAGYVVFAVTYAAMAIAQSELSAWLIFLLYGVYMGISDGNSRALLAELAPRDRQGTAFGFYHGVVGLAALPASALAGILWDEVSHAAPFWVGAGAASLAALLLLLLVPAHPQSARAA